MKQNYTSCNFLSPQVIKASVPFYSLSVRIKREIINLKNFAVTSIIDILHPKKNKKVTSHEVSSKNNSLNLQPGDWVQVKSVEEIFETLDDRQKYKGLYFMPEMEKFCGKNFKVFKKVEIIKLESTGEIRKLKTPSIFLEDVYCNGELHEGCDRSCFHFWKEAWLKK